MNNPDALLREILVENDQNQKSEFFMALSPLLGSGREQFEFFEKQGEEIVSGVEKSMESCSEEDRNELEKCLAIVQAGLESARGMLKAIEFLQGEIEVPAIRISKN